MLLNFGGNVGLFGRIDAVINHFYDVNNYPSAKNMKGIGLTMEGIENNPIMYELVTELPWRNQRFDKSDWARDYIKARYGKHNAEIEQAWDILIHNNYNCPDNLPQEGTSESIF